VKGYQLTPRARDGVREALEYVEQRFGALVAERVLGQLVSAFESIAETPGIGHRREEITMDDQIRFWSVGPSLIAYRVRTGRPLEILFVERGERDWDLILGQGK